MSHTATLFGKHNAKHASSIKPIILAISLALTNHSLLAQELTDSPDDSEDENFEVIQVTASKRVTSLQETPIAVTVTSGETIDQSKVLDIQDLQTLVPTLRVTPLQRSANTNFSIRGFGNGTNNTGIEPSVGVFIDGVYRSRAAAQIGDLPKVEQVEVLSGPQSTLFGKNASAGVINVRTALPSYVSEGKFELGIGNYKQGLIRGYYTNSINESLAFSVSAGANKRDGYTKSVVGLDQLNNRDRWNLRGQLLYEPNDDTRIRLIADYSEIDETCCTAADVINGPTTLAVRALGGVVLDESDPFAFQSALNINPVNRVEDGGISIQVDIDFDSFAFTSISAFRNNEANYLSDVDFTSLDILIEEGHTQIDTFTQELRLTSTEDTDFRWMLGTFIFQESVDTGDTLFFGDSIRNYFNLLGLQDLFTAVEGVYGLEANTFFAADTILNSEFDQQNDAYSLFISVDYDLSDSLTATLGASYTKDSKEVSIESINTDSISAIDFENDPTLFGVPLSLIPDLAPFVSTLQGVQFLPQQLEFPNSIENGNTDDGKATWSLRLAYELNAKVNIFANAATGFKASSWNLSRDTRPFASDEAALTSANLTQPNQAYGTRYAGPEESTVYELGIKSQFSTGAINLSLFDQTIKGFQSSTFVGTGFVLANAGQQSTTGAEIDAVWRPTDDLSLNFGLMLLDPVYDSFVGGQGLDGVEDLSGKRPAGIPKRSFTAGVVYTTDLRDNWIGYWRADYLHESETRLVANVPASLVREVNTINTAAGIDFDNGFGVQIWVRNLNNDQYFLSAFPPPIQAGSYNAYPNQPRTFGASLNYQF